MHWQRFFIEIGFEVDLKFIASATVIKVDTGLYSIEQLMCREFGTVKDFEVERVYLVFNYLICIKKIRVY